jgi:uncharacterized integral membrane protein
MSRNTIALAILLSTACIDLAVALLNPAAISLNLLGTTMEMPAGVIVFVSWALGATGALAVVWSAAVHKQTQDKHLATWAAQDVKLSASLQSDREKQLEAKIATLEAALQRVLKKS